MLLKVSTRFGLAGLGGLGLLSGVQWLRTIHHQRGDFGAWVLGIAPNFAAAIAITFVLLAVWSDTSPSADGAALKSRFIASAAVSSTGLIGWEFVQMSSRSLVFDWQDVQATLAGIAASALLFVLLYPSPDR